MASHVDIQQMDKIIKKTIEAIDKSKSELFDIAEIARRERDDIKKELEMAKLGVAELTAYVKELEVKLAESKKELMYSNKYFDKYSEEEKKKIYEKTQQLMIDLAVNREMEQMAIRRRNELEFRLRDAEKMVERAENLISAIGTVLNYLSGSLQSVTMKLEDLQQKRSFGFKILKALEEERRRIAREIHDGPAQSMSNIVLKAEICERLIDNDLQNAKEEIKNLKSVVRQTLQDVRRIIYDLRPMSLDDLGLIPTLQRYINSYIEANKIPIDLRIRGVVGNVKSVISLTIFRVIQEALSNIKKHANAKSVIINLDFSEKEISLSIIDNGVGFDLEELKSKHFDINGGFGLQSMRERIELLGGKFEIISHKGKGTRLTAVIPRVEEEGGPNE